MFWSGSLPPPRPAAWGIARSDLDAWPFAWCHRDLACRPGIPTRTDSRLAHLKLGAALASTSAESADGGPTNRLVAAAREIGRLRRRNLSVVAVAHLPAPQEDYLGTLLAEQSGCTKGSDDGTWLVRFTDDNRSSVDWERNKMLLTKDDPG
jgi:hypothetical protein